MGQLGLPKVAEVMNNDDNDDNDDTQTEAEYAQTNIRKLNIMQRHMYDIIMNNVDEALYGTSSQCRAYFLDGPG